jgi:hypothetical protein
MKNKINKKGAMLSIVVIVLFAIILVLTCLFYFVTSKSHIVERLNVHDSISALYIEEAQVNYLISQIFEDSVKNLNSNNLLSKEEILNLIRNQLILYKPDKFYLQEARYLSQVENQLIPENIEISSDKVVLKLAINLQKNKIIDGREVIYATYSYNKQFEKIIS